MTRSKNPPVRQQAGCSALQLHPSSPRSPCSSRPLEQINNVGQNHQPYDGKEHEDENIQHGAILSRGVAWIPGKWELQAWRSVSAEKWLLFPPPFLVPPPPRDLRLRDAATPSAAYSQPITKPTVGNQGTASFRPGKTGEVQFLPRKPAPPLCVEPLSI